MRITREKDCFLIPYLILFNVVRSFEEEIMMSLTEVAKKFCVFLHTNPFLAVNCKARAGGAAII